MKITDEMREEFRDIIIQHFSSPLRKGELKAGKNIFSARQQSAVCADNIYIQLKIENGIIKDGRFSGLGCAFSIAAADILLENICGMSIKDAYDYLLNYNNMCIGKDYKINEGDEIRIFQTVRVEINRVNCVLLAAEGLRNILQEKL